jgi:hypothetical protein
MKARRPIRSFLASGVAGLALLVASGAGAGPTVAWVQYITPDGRFHATRDPSAVPPDAAALRPSPVAALDDGELCHTVERLDDRGLGYWARQGVLRVQADDGVRACLDRSSAGIAQAMARHCQEDGTRGYQVWSDLVSRALRDCEG